MLLVVGMFGFGFALVPMYDVLCKVTGLGGRTGDLYVYDPAKVTPDESRLVKVTFLTNVNDGMTWEFRSEQGAVHVHPGELSEAKFFVRNTSDHVMVAQAVPSLAPGSAAEFFHKTECFCFTAASARAGAESRNADAILRVAGSAARTGIDFSFVHFIRRHAARSRRSDFDRGLSTRYYGATASWRHTITITTTRSTTSRTTVGIPSSSRSAFSCRSSASVTG